MKKDDLYYLCLSDEFRPVVEAVGAFTEDEIDPLTEEFYSAKHGAMVRDCDGRHLILDSSVYEIIYLAAAVKKAVFGMLMEMNKIRMNH